MPSRMCKTDYKCLGRSFSSCHPFQKSDETSQLVTTIDRHWYPTFSSEMPSLPFQVLEQVPVSISVERWDSTCLCILKMLESLKKTSGSKTCFNFLQHIRTVRHTYIHKLSKACQKNQYVVVCGSNLPVFSVPQFLGVKIYSRNIDSNSN